MVSIWDVDSGDTLTFENLVRVDSRTVGIPFDVDHRFLALAIPFEEGSQDFDFDKELELMTLPIGFTII